MDPILNPAVELQAINRVHRIGQKEITYVHRFIVQNTIEGSFSFLFISKSWKKKNQKFQLLIKFFFFFEKKRGTSKIIRTKKKKTQ